MNDFNDCNNMFGLREGDRIRVIAASGASDTGTFIRFSGNFIIWIRDFGGNPRFTSTNLSGISITRL